MIKGSMGLGDKEVVNRDFGSGHSIVSRASRYSNCELPDLSVHCPQIKSEGQVKAAYPRQPCRHLQASAARGG